MDDARAPYDKIDHVAPGYNVGQFDVILHRLNLIAGQLASVPTPSREVATVSAVPDLKVLPGRGG
jgi:hypothetical protein